MQAFLMKVFKFLLPFLKALGKALLLPLITDLFKKITDYFEMKRVEKENQKKADDYVKADSVDNARDAFNKLP